MGVSWQGGNHKELFDICFNSEAKKRSRASSANTHSLTKQRNKTRHKNVREHFVVRSAAGKAGRSKGAALRSSRYGAELPHRHPGGASPLSIAHYTHLITHICPPVYTGRRAGRSLAPLDGNRPCATARAASVHTQDRVTWGALGSDARSEVHR